MSSLFDTHSHMYLSDFDGDIDVCMQRAVVAGVATTALPNIDSGSIARVKQLMQAYPLQTIGMMGLHPCSIKQNYQNELNIIKAELDTGDYKAVGEIGIDLYWDKTFFKEQLDAFRIQIGWAKDKKLPIVIHARDSFKEICDVLDEMHDEQLTGVFHCFTGNIDDANRALSFKGFYLGIGGVVTFKTSSLGEVISQTGLERIVLETDAPYLTPAPFRGKRNETAYTQLVAEKIAHFTDIPVDQVASITTRNAYKLFKIDA